MLKAPVVLVACLFSLTVAGPVRPQSSKPQQPLTKKEVRTLIANARTAADHERLADYYRSETRRLMSEAKEHEHLARVYGDRTSLNDPNYYNIGRAARHCHNLAKDYSDTAKEAQDMAAIHEEIAKNLQSQAEPARR